MMALAGGSPTDLRLLRQERRRRMGAIVVFALAYAVVCALVVAPRGTFVADTAPVQVALQR